MSVQDSPLANHVREQHLLKATHSHQLPAAAASSGRNTSHQPTLESLLEGYQLSNTEGYPVLSIDFNDGGSVWSKLIWTRKSLPRVLYRWNTPEEILSYLISFDRHKSWITADILTRPPSGTIRLYNKTKTKNFREDGYDWKTRASKKTVREDRMKLKVLGHQLICATYSHSESNPLLHRRCYWFTQNPDIVLVHYLETDSNSHKKAVLKRSQENGFEVTMDGTVPSDITLLAISDENMCSYLAKGHDGEKPQLLLSTLSKYVQFASSQNSDICPGTLIRKLNEKLLTNITTSSSPEAELSTPPVLSHGNVPMLLISQALELLKLKAYSSQYGGSSCLLPKGAGCLPPSILLQAASLIMSPNPAPPLPIVYVNSHQLATPQAQPPVDNNNTRRCEPDSDVLHPLRPPSLDSIRSFLPQPLESDCAATSVSTSPLPQSLPKPTASSTTTPHGTDFNMEAFSQFAQNLRNMNPLRDLQNLKNSNNTNETSNEESSFTDNSYQITSQHSSTLNDSMVELNALEKQAISLLTPNQLSDLMSMDFDSAVVPPLPQPPVDYHQTLQHDCYQSTNDTTTTASSAQSFLEQFFDDISPAPSTPFNPDSLLQTPSAMMSSSSTTADSSDTVVDSSPPLSTDDSSSRQLDIDNETLAQLLANSNDNYTIDHQVEPFSPTSHYIESLVPCYDDHLVEEPPLVSSSEQHIGNTGMDSGPSAYIVDESMDSSGCQESPVTDPVPSVDYTAPVVPTSSVPTQPLPPMSLSFHQSPSSGGIDPSTVSPTSLSYRASSPPLPSPSSTSVSSLSTPGGGESYFDQTDPPSVAELCELLGDSRVVQTSDFSHLSLSDSEQQQLIEASRVIQNTMRKCNHHETGKEKDAVLCIERSYKRYRELKRMKDAAARRIQLQYRLYRRRTNELNRATLFIQQMYRYQKRKHNHFSDKD